VETGGAVEVEGVAGLVVGSRIGVEPHPARRIRMDEPMLTRLIRWRTSIVRPFWDARSISFAAPRHPGSHRSHRNSPPALRLRRCSGHHCYRQSRRTCGHAARSAAGGILWFERCRLVFRASLAKHMRFVSTNPSGCSAVVAHVLWEPLGPMRPRVDDPEHERPSGVGTDYCAVREHETGGSWPFIGHARRTMTMSSGSRSTWASGRLAGARPARDRSVLGPGSTYSKYLAPGRLPSIT
jgi:hypothetical protein